MGQAKNTGNRAKYVSFETAKLVFEFPRAFGSASRKVRTVGTRWECRRNRDLAGGSHGSRPGQARSGPNPLRPRGHAPGREKSMNKVSRRQARELAAFARLPDQKIDLTDAPESREWGGGGSSGSFAAHQAARHHSCRCECSRMDEAHWARLSPTHQHTSPPGDGRPRRRRITTKEAALK
jgi:hypothetical protein